MDTLVRLITATTTFRREVPKHVIMKDRSVLVEEIIALQHRNQDSTYQKQKLREKTQRELKETPPPDWGKSIREKEQKKKGRESHFQECF